MDKSTIAVTPQTLELLKHAREEANARSYDELLRILVLRTKKPKEDLFGKFKDLKEFRREEIDRL